jgi:hypothetical protein
MQKSLLLLLFQSGEQEHHHDKAVTREPHRGKLHAPTEKRTGRSELNHLFSSVANQSITSY